jgi:hypothetical protein
MVELTPSQEPELAHLGVPGWLNQGDSTGALKMWRFSILTPVMFRLRIHRDGAVIHEVSVGEAMKGRCADLLRDRGREAVDSPRATVSGQGVLFFRQEHIPTVGISSRDLTDGTDPPSFAKLSLSGSVRMDNTDTGSMEASMHEDVTTKLSDFLTVAELEQSVKGQLVFRGTGGGGGTVKLDHNSLQKPQRVMYRRWKVYEKGNRQNSEHVYLWELIVESGGGWAPRADAKGKPGSSTSQTN